MAKLQKNGLTYIKGDNDFRDYEITFLLDGEEQRWIGEARSLMHSHPKAKIINIKHTGR